MPRARIPCVYILVTTFNGTFYVGVTSDLPARIAQHREGALGRHTRKHAIKRLVYWEVHETMAAAIHREKQLKRYRREYKMNLIERENPHWNDLAPALGLPPLAPRKPDK